MNRTNFIVSLAKYRVVKDGIQKGHSRAVAAAEADALVREQGLTGFFAKIKVMSIPEGALVHMVETYMTSMSTQERLGEKDDEKIRRNAARNIEQHRSRMVPGRSNYPTDLYNYIIYRTELEIPALLHKQANAIGLDRETITEQITATLAYLHNGTLLLAA